MLERFGTVGSPEGRNIGTSRKYIRDASDASEGLERIGTLGGLRVDS